MTFRSSTQKITVKGADSKEAIELIKKALEDYNKQVNYWKEYSNRYYEENTNLKKQLEEVGESEAFHFWLAIMGWLCMVISNITWTIIYFGGF